jgi:putative addiction module component (TIGR02574 family)
VTPVGSSGRFTALRGGHDPRPALGYLGVEDEMTHSARTLLNKIMKLSPEQRVGLAYEILESVEHDEAEELTPEWREEIERRVQAILSGDAGPGEDYRVVMKRLKRRYEKKHGKKKTR